MFSNVWSAGWPTTASGARWVEHVAEALARQTGIRDYIDRGAGPVQAFLAAYLGMTEHFVLHSEGELAKGFADLQLEPVTARPDGPRHGYVIELKYLKRGEPAAAAVVKERLEGAKEQLRRYLRDEGLCRRPAFGTSHRPRARLPRLGAGGERRNRGRLNAGASGARGGCIDANRNTRGLFPARPRSGLLVWLRVRAVHQLGHPGVEVGYGRLPLASTPRTRT